eukprot:656673-Amphidinium_carterae.2
MRCVAHCQTKLQKPLRLHQPSSLAVGLFARASSFAVGWFSLAVAIAPPQHRCIYFCCDHAWALGAMPGIDTHTRCATATTQVRSCARQIAEPTTSFGVGPCCLLYVH